MAVLRVYVHWQSVPIRNFALLLMIAYTVWMHKHHKFNKTCIILGYLVAAFGIVWNTESGLFAVISYTAAIIVLRLQKNKWYEKKMLITYVVLVLLCVLSVGFALFIVNLYNLLCGGEVIFKDFFYPYTEEIYMESWGNASNIGMALGNQAWIYTLVGFALLLLMGLYYVIVKSREKTEPYTLASVYTVVAMSGMTMFSYYASRPVYVSLDTVFFFSSISMAIFGDKFISGFHDIVRKRYSFVKICCKSIGVISVAVLTVLSSQIVLTPPSLLYKANNFWNPNEFKTQAEMIRKAIPEDAMLIGAGTSTYKLQLGRTSQYYYRHNDAMTIGTDYIERLVENAQKYDYVAFSLKIWEDKLSRKTFLESSPEYKCVSVNRIGGVDFVLYNRLDRFSCTYLASSLPILGVYDDMESEIILKTGSIQYGPYIDLEPGNFSVKIEGSGLSAATYDVLADKSTHISVTEISHSDTEIQYLFSIENAANIEFRTFNSSEQNVVLDNIKLMPCD